MLGNVKVCSPAICDLSTTATPKLELIVSQKIRDRQLAAPLESEDLQILCLNELKTEKHTATEGLLWLVRYAFSLSLYYHPKHYRSTLRLTLFLPRGLDFTSQAISKNLAAPSDELSTSFRAAYGNTLKPHHSFMVKPIFSAAMSATPYRKDFYSKLGNDQEQVKREMETWLKSLEAQVVILKAFLASKEAKW